MAQETTTQARNVIAVMIDTLLELFIERTGGTVYVDEIAPGIEVGDDLKTGEPRSYLMSNFLFGYEQIIRGMEQLGDEALAPCYTLVKVVEGGVPENVNVPNLSLKDIAEYIHEHYVRHPQATTAKSSSTWRLVVS